VHLQFNTIQFNLFLLVVYSARRATCGRVRRRMVACVRRVESSECTTHRSTTTSRRQSFVLTVSASRHASHSLRPAGPRAAHTHALPPRLPPASRAHAVGRPRNRPPGATASIPGDRTTNRLPPSPGLLFIHPRSPLSSTVAKKISIVIAGSQASTAHRRRYSFSSICLPSILPPTAGTPAAS
jgi:hypothetical protein